MRRTELILWSERQLALRSHTLYRWVTGRHSCCDKPLRGPHYRYCLTRYSTRRERFEERLDVHTRRLRGRCPQCGLKKAHKMDCTRR